MSGARTFFDVIIVGAGPAGLAVGSELSRNCRVLVLDSKRRIDQTAKSWFVPAFVTDGMPADVRRHAYRGVRRFLTRTWAGISTVWKAKLPKGYLYVRESILAGWGKIIRRNGSTVLLRCSYRGHRTAADGVTVRTSRGTFRAKLLIDASGYDSKILKRYRIKSNYYWWSVFGCIARHPRGLSGMKVGDYMLWGTFRDTNDNVNASLQEGRPVFEYEILDGETSFPLILYLRKKKVPLAKMKKEFVRILRTQESTRDFHDVKIGEWKFGYYPSGGKTPAFAADRVVFIGDAGCWTTPCGWGMAMILANYRRYAVRILDALDRGRLDKKSLQSLKDWQFYRGDQLLLNQIAAHFLSNATASQLDRFIKFFDTIDPLYCEKVFTLTVTHKDLRYILREFLKHFSLQELVYVMPREDYLLILGEIKEFVEDYLLTETRALINEYAKQGIRRYLKDPVLARQLERQRKMIGAFIESRFRSA